MKNWKEKKKKKMPHNWGHTYQSAYKEILALSPQIAHQTWLWAHWILITTTYNKYLKCEQLSLTMIQGNILFDFLIYCLVGVQNCRSLGPALFTTTLLRKYLLLLLLLLLFLLISSGRSENSIANYNQRMSLNYKVFDKYYKSTP